MKLFSALAVVCFVVVAVTAQTKPSSPKSTDKTTPAKPTNRTSLKPNGTSLKPTSKDPWQDFKRKHGKNYNATDDFQRKQIFLAKDAQITKHNSQNNATYQLGHNDFSDMTPTELGKYRGAVRPANATQLSLMSTMTSTTVGMTSRELPTSLDYRTSPCLTAVKNQGSCGSCWAFAAITPLEFAQCKKYGSLVLLSEQQLIDSDPYDSGCNGGWYTNAWYYIKNVAGGSAKQSLYTYSATVKPYKFTSSMIGAKIFSYGSLSTPNAVNMQTALQLYGPIAVAMTVVNSFYSYKSGVYADLACNRQSVNHAVVVVGWGTTGGVDYWIVRNSWGTSWGISGYFFIKRGVNMCSIETYPAVIVSVV